MRYAFLPLVCLSRRASRYVWLSTLAGLLWLCLPSPASFAAASGSISGVVRYQGNALPDQRIMLVRFGPNQQDVQRTPGQTNAQGQFLFENLETGSDYTYVVGVRHNEQLHRSTPVTLQHEQRAELFVDIAGTSPSEPDHSSRPSPLYIANHLMVVVRRETSLEVREIVRLVQTGETVETEEPGAPQTAQPAFRLLLPQGYYNLSQVQGLAPEHIRMSATSLSYMAPLTPGEHRVIFAYSLPWHDDLTTILLERTLPTTLLDLLVEEQRLISTSDLTFSGQVTIDPHTFVHFRGVNLNPQARSWLQLTPPTMALSSWLTGSAYGFIAILALLGLTVPFYTRQQRGTLHPKSAKGLPTQTQTDEARTVAKRMLHELALLDESREAGHISEDSYQQRRKACKARLKNLLTAFYG